MNIEDRYNLAPIWDATLEMYEKNIGNIGLHISKRRYNNQIMFNI